MSLDRVKHIVLVGHPSSDRCRMRRAEESKILTRGNPDCRSSRARAASANPR